MQETRKVSFKQEEIHVSSTSSEMTSATKTIQETQVQEQVEQQGNTNGVLYDIYNKCAYLVQV